MQSSQHHRNDILCAGAIAVLLALSWDAPSRSLTASELVQRLQVSPASVSKAITFLENQSLVRRERDERRRERYVVDDDIWYQSTIASARAAAMVAETARQGVAVLGSATLAGARLENVARFSDFISEAITRAAEQVHEILVTKPAVGPSNAVTPESEPPALDHDATTG